MRPNTLLMSLALALCAPALCSSALYAADNNEVKSEFEKAFTKGESSDKKDALRMAQSLGKDQDDLAFELLIRGVSDRQVHDEAVIALRARTGLQPTLLNRGSGYPGYPASDDASEWNNWLGQRKKEKDALKKIAENSAKLKEFEDAEKKKAAEAKDGKPGEKNGEKPAPDGEKPADGEKPVAKPPYEQPSDLGKLDRLVFKTGGSLVCYVLSKRVNADGQLQSVRVVHQNNGGEEILAADLIARIDEDIR
jgi:hypothetical protein